MSGIKPQAAAASDPRGSVLLEIVEAGDILNTGGAQYSALIRDNNVGPWADGDLFYPSSQGGGFGAITLANGRTARVCVSAVATGAVIANRFNFPLRNRSATVAPIIPVAYRRLRRFTYEVTMWRSGMTAAVACEASLMGQGTGAPSEAFQRAKFGFRSLLAENATNWQTASRLVDGAGGLTLADTGVAVLSPHRFRFVFDEGPVPTLRMFIDDVLKLNTTVMPTAIAQGALNTGMFAPSIGAEGAIGDNFFACDSVYRVELL